MAFGIRITGGPLRRAAEWCVMLMALGIARGEHLPIKLYTAADGLPSTEIWRVIRDSHGLLWFCTAEGLSSFDGYTFTNYGIDQQLPDAGAVDLLETRNHQYWVATASGISRFLPGSSFEKNPAGARRQRFFEVYRFPPHNQLPPRRAVQLAEAPDGRIWCLTNAGLLRFDRASKQFEVIDTAGHSGYTTLLQENDGGLWLGGQYGLIRRRPDGRVETYGEAEGLPVWKGGSLRVGAILRDRDGGLWVATWLGLCRMSTNPMLGRKSVKQVYTRREGLTDDAVMALFQSQDGTIWAATEFGLSRFVPGSGKTPDRFRSYTARRGLDLPGVGGLVIVSFAEDNRNNLWMVGAGAMRLARGAFTTYSVDDGLAADSVASVLEDREGRLIAISGKPAEGSLNLFDGERFLPVMPRVPKGTLFTWGHGQIHFQDHTGVWWLATGLGLCRYPKMRRTEDLSHILPERVFTTRDGLPGNGIFALFEDSRGDVWISVLGPNVVTRWSRADGSIRVFRQSESGQPLGTPTAFAEDHAGNVWMGLYWRDLMRYRDGRFEVFTTAEGLPAGVVTGLLVDHAGRLWVGSSEGGLARIDDPAAGRPRFSVYTTSSGLASNGITSVTEDASGRIYLGTGRGIERLDPETGRVKHYGEADGVQMGAAVAYRDRQGTLWFGSVRFTPSREDPSAAPPPIRITRVRVRGAERAISELGESSIQGLRLKPAENQVQIDFASLNFGVGETIRYQYRLQGTESDWGPLVDLRSVNYAVLSPGSYRFLVRAVNSDGVASAAPASVEFTILPPIWLRWWFWTAAVGALALAALSWHRYRLRQALELERVRTHIATDLHDDIGSSLAQIVVLSEVIERNMSGQHAASAQLARIADLSRDLVGSMSDIVWSINPQRDHVSDLAQRMRRFAGEVLGARDIDFEFSAPVAAGQTAVRAEVRRQTFLIFKECVHNILRHAGCTSVDVALRIEQRRLLLRVEDDGKGVARSPDGQGHGIVSMEQRARAMGGSFEIASEPGRGTAVTLIVPLDPKPVQKKTT
jgi:signal transduction histidine kinase/ligand-binding sensor domain-containing protein